MADVSVERALGSLRLFWMDCLNTSFGCRGMMVEAARR